MRKGVVYSRIRVQCVSNRSFVGNFLRAERAVEHIEAPYMSGRTELFLVAALINLFGANLGISKA
jgi:hypothetical protein